MAQGGRDGGVSYDARTGFKVKGRKLRSDGERPGVWTTDPDPVHPQRFLRPPGPDGRGWRPGLPSTDAVRADYAWGRLDWRDENKATLGFAVGIGAFACTVGCALSVPSLAPLTLPNGAFTAA